MEALSIVETTKGNPCALYNGYQYRRKKVLCGGRVRWVCINDKQNKCTGKMLTLEESVISVTDHQCKPDMAKVEVRARVTSAKKRAREGNEAISCIINEEIGSLYSKGLQFVSDIPHNQNIRKVLNRSRQKTKVIEPAKREEIILNQEELKMNDESYVSLDPNVSPPNSVSPPISVSSPIKDISTEADALRRKVKLLQQQLKRGDIKIKNLNNTISVLKKRAKAPEQLLEAKKRAREESVSISKIYSEEMGDLHNRGYDLVTEMPSRSSLKRSMQKNRSVAQGNQKEPKHHDGIVLDENEESGGSLPKKRPRKSLEGRVILKGRRRKLLADNVEGRNSVTCCALACTNTSESHVLTRLPSDLERRDQWISRINREDWTPTKDSAVCQIHFAADAWEEDALGVRVLKGDVFPTLHLHGEDSVEDELARNSSDDNSYHEASETCVYIKQEVLEPDIDMLEESPGVEKPFEAVYLDSKIDETNDEASVGITKIKVEPVNESGEENNVPDVFPEIIKSEPLDIIDEQTIATTRCSECNEDFEEVWDLEQHVKDKHSESESTKMPPKMPKQYPPTRTASPPLLKVLPPGLTNVTASTPTCSSSTSTQSQGTSLSVTPLVVTSHSLSSAIDENKLPITLQKGESTLSKQYVVLISKTDGNKQSKFLPVAGPSSAVAPSPPPPPTPTTSTTIYTIDSSDRFTISLAQFPESLRVGIKRKMLEVVETVKKLKINPEMIIIAHKAVNV